MRSPYASHRQFSVVVAVLSGLAIIAAAVLVALTVLPGDALSRANLGFFREEGGERGVALAVILLAVLVPLGFHVAFGRLLQRSEHSIGKLENMGSDVREAYRRRKPADASRAKQQSRRNP